MKKLMRKLLAVVAALTMVLGMSIPTFAATINVTNVLDGETYTAYKILNYTKADTGTATSYYLTSDEYNQIGKTLETAGFHFTESADHSQYYVDNADTLDVADAASKLATASLGNALGKYEATGKDQSANFENLPAGYYFITTTTGSFCALHSDTDIANAVEKNTVPSVEKKVSDTGDANDWNDTENAAIGDTLHFKLTVTDGTGTDKDIVLTDTMSKGLTYTANSIKIDDTSVADNADTNNYKVVVDGQKITITLKAAYVKSLEKDATVVITYDATLNENAVAGTDDTNTVKLDYSRQSQSDNVAVKNYKFNVHKYDGKDVNKALLPDAMFQLQNTDGNLIKLVKVNDTNYRVAKPNEEGTTDTFKTVSTGEITITGVDKDKSYQLVETEAPKGYNKLSAPKIVELNADNSADVEVANNQGSILPSTGGIGTTIFYVLGAALAIGAGVVLVTRRRLSK